MMALADFHYTTGISSGFKVYILEGHPSFESEQRLPPPRWPLSALKRRTSGDTQGRPEERPKVAKLRRSPGRMADSSQDLVAPTAARLPSVPVAVPCVATPRAECCRGSPVLHPACPQKCPLRRPLLDPASFTVSQLQQMRPSVITCAPRRSCPETPPSTSPPISPMNQKNNITPDFPHSQRLLVWTASPPEPSAQCGRKSSPKEKIQEANKNLSPFP